LPNTTKPPFVLLSGRTKKIDRQKQRKQLNIKLFAGAVLLVIYYKEDFIVGFYKCPLFSFSHQRDIFLKILFFTLMIQLCNSLKKTDNYGNRNKNLGNN